MAIYGFDENKDKIEVPAKNELDTRTKYFNWLSHSFSSRLNAIWTLHNKLKAGETCTCLTKIENTTVFITGGKSSANRGSYIYSSVTSTTLISARIDSTTNNSVAFSQITSEVEMSEPGGQIEDI